MGHLLKRRKEKEKEEEKGTNQKPDKPEILKHLPNFSPHFPISPFPEKRILPALRSMRIRSRQ